MGLSQFQRDVCHLLAENRLLSGESYLAGGTALNELLHAARRSQDIDLFHDTEEALAASWQADRSLLEGHGYSVRVFRERPGLVEADVTRIGGHVLVQWARDSAYRFFPLVRHDELGLVLHPFDLATAKVLALVGRAEPRDFVDTLACDEAIQSFGCLAWAACGKDPGFSPASILEEAARANRYAAAELAGLDFEGTPPDPAELSRRWRRMLAAARDIVATLPAEEAGRAVLLNDGGLFTGDVPSLRAALEAGHIVFHPGAIRGAMPQLLRR